MYPGGRFLRGSLFGRLYAEKDALYRQASPPGYHGICQEFPETFKGLGHPNKLPFSPKAMLASMIHLCKSDNLR